MEAALEQQSPSGVGWRWVGRGLAVLGVAALAGSLVLAQRSPRTESAPVAGSTVPIALPSGEQTIVGARIIAGRLYALTGADSGVALHSADLVATGAGWSGRGTHLVATLRPHNEAGAEPGSNEAADTDTTIAVSVELATGSVTQWQPLGPVVTVGTSAVSASVSAAQRVDLLTGDVSEFAVEFPDGEQPYAAQAIAGWGKDGVLVATTPRNSDARHPGWLWRVRPHTRPIKLGPILATHPPTGLVTHPSQRWVVGVEPTAYECSDRHDQPVIFDVETGEMLRPVLPLPSRSDADSIVTLNFTDDGTLVGRRVEPHTMAESADPAGACEVQAAATTLFSLADDGDLEPLTTSADLDTLWRPARDNGATPRNIPFSQSKAPLLALLTGHSSELTRRGVGVISLGVPPGEVAERTGTRGLTFNWDYLDGRQCFWTRPGAGDLGIRVLVADANIAGMEVVAPTISGPSGLQVGTVPDVTTATAGVSSDGSTTITVSGVTARLNADGVVDRLSAGNTNCPGDS